MSYLHGTFKDTENKEITVEIRSTTGNKDIVIGEELGKSDIYFSYDPVNISLSLNDMFEVILKKTARITLESKVYLGDVLFAGNVNDVSVKIYREGQLLFDGYAEANSFNQPWAYQLESFEINCVDKLSLLQYKYWTDKQSYNSLLSDVNNYSFYDILKKIELDAFNVYYDNSKNINGNSIWTTLGISMNVFLGDSEDKVMNYEEILTHILKYFNLHIVQDGADFYIFDWQNIKDNNLNWTNLFGNDKSTKTAAEIAVGKDMYSDDSSSLSMSEVYNQIQVKCIVDDITEVIPSVLDSGDLSAIYPGRQLCITEAWYDGGNKNKEAASFFQNSQMFKDENSNSVSVSDNNAWHVKDWYMQWMTNPNYTLHYKNSIIDSFIPYDGTNPSYQTNLLKLLYENKFMPALISIGCGNEVKNGVSRISGSPDMKNYLVISGCAGWGYKEYSSSGALSANHYDGRFNSFTELLEAIDNERINASGSTGLLSYDSGTALSASPIDNDTTNFIIIQGNILLEPIHWKASWGSGGKNSDGSFRGGEQSGDNVSWGTMMDWLTYSDHKYFGGRNHYSYQGGILGHYAQVPWTARTYNATNKPDLTQGTVYLSPPVNDRGIGTNWIRERLKYNKSKTAEGWSDKDTINKISVLECELKIGDKYCVEDINNLDEYGCPTFHWLTASQCEAQGYQNKSFTIGFDPAIGDLIVGKFYPLTNTVDGRKLDNVQGMAIPIKKSDELSGVVTFKIKGVLDLTWDTYFVQNKSFNSSYIKIEGTQHLWYEIASIWIQDFKILFRSDNGGATTKENSSDIVYMSTESHDYIKKKDDIEFYINTQLPSNEAANYGLNSSIAYSNVLNLSTNLGVENITAPNGTNRAEKLYIDQYWNMYNIPKVILNTQLHNKNYSIFDTFTFKGFGKMMPFGIDVNLKRNVVDLQCRQV